MWTHRFIETQSFNVNFDPDAVAYFTAASITSMREKLAVNNLILTLKSAGIWGRLDLLYLMSPTSASAALVCAKSLTSLTNVNSVSFSTSGLTFNGTTNYLSGPVANTLTQLQLNSASFGAYISAGEASSSMSLIGANFKAAQQMRLEAGASS